MCFGFGPDIRMEREMDPMNERTNERTATNPQTNINIGIKFKCIGYIVISSNIILGKFIGKLNEVGGRS